MSTVGSNVDDLEEGEIEEDALEDISDCSLSEAIATQKDLENDSEVELLREEALKSLQENDDVTEEDLCRLEALRSLLTNMESFEEISVAGESRKKKRKHKKKSRRKKATKLESDEVLEPVNACEKSKSLVEASEEHTSTSQVENSSSNIDFSDKENQTDSDMNLVTRSWYPKTDFALLNFYVNEVSNETKQQPRKSYGNDDFIIIPRILSVANNDTKPIIRETMPVRKPVNPSLTLNRLRMPVTRASVPISKLNTPVLSSAAHLSRYKKISKHHIQKYPVIQPANRFSLRNVKKGKYKIVNKSCYSLKKSVNASPAKTEKQNTRSKSVYSLNRVQNQPASSKNSQFIIEFDEDESGKEDSGSVVSVKKPNVKVSEMKNLDELPCSELPNGSIQTAENSDESDTEKSASVVEKESIIESVEMIVAENGNEDSDLQNDEEMPLSEVTTSTALTPTCDDSSISENNEHISSGMCAEEMTAETEVSEMITDAVERHPVSPGTCADERELRDETETSKMIADGVEEHDDISSSLHPSEMIPSNVTDVSKITSDAVEECDVGFPQHSNSCDVGSPQHSNSIAENEQLTKGLDVFKFIANFLEGVVIKREPFDDEPVEDFSMKDTAECVVTNDAEIDDRRDLMVLQDVEADLIEIRARLLINLGELEESIKKDELEREKLNAMLKKLLMLKSSIFKFEDKIRVHQSKLSIHADTMQALFKDVAERTDSCTQMKDVCLRVGMEIMGPQYKPPDLYENVIDEKIKAMDFSKYMPNLK